MPLPEIARRRVEHILGDFYEVYRSWFLGHFARGNHAGGDRSANHALWRIVMVRMVFDARTRAYVARRTAEGRSKREIIRSLKRYVARELYRCLPRPEPA